MQPENTNKNDPSLFTVEVLLDRILKLKEQIFIARKTILKCDPTTCEYKKYFNSIIHMEKEILKLIEMVKTAPTEAEQLENRG